MKYIIAVLVSLLISGCTEDKTVNDPQVNLNKKDYLVTLDEMPMPEGGMEAIQANIIYPAEAKGKGIQGKVMVKAFVDEKGNVKIVEVLQGADPLLDKAALDAVTKVKFTPGYKDGKRVNSQVVIPIVFKLNGDTKKTGSFAKSGEYYTEADRMPEIVGGIQAIMSNIKYPESEKKAGRQGKILIKVYIDEEGNIEKTEVVDGVNPVLDKAALDAFENIKFTPGEIGDKKVKVSVVVPILFKLQ